MDETKRNRSVDEWARTVADRIIAAMQRQNELLSIQNELVEEKLDLIAHAYRVTGNRNDRGLHRRRHALARGGE